MKSRYYIAIPFVCTAFNALLVLYLAHRAPPAKAESLIPTLPESAESGPVADLCYDNAVGCDNDAVTADTGAPFGFNPQDHSSELKKMPGYDFKAYVRRDVSSFYEEEPHSRKETVPDHKGQAGKFVNMSPERLDVYWDPGQGQPGNYITTLGPFDSGGTSTHPGHKFYFAKKGHANEPVCNIHVVSKAFVYYYDPYSTTDAKAPGRCMPVDGRQAPRSLDELSEEDKMLYHSHIVNMEFGAAYKNFTGSEWLTKYPKNPPKHYIRPADYFGQTFHVHSSESQFTKLPPADKLAKLTLDDYPRPESDVMPLAKYREPDGMDITMTVVSCEPRIFQIEDFLSEAEADHLLEIASTKNLQLSTTGDGYLRKADKATRTSKNTWISRYSSPIVDTIYRRVSDMLNLDESLLRHRHKNEHPEFPSSQPISEDLQLVHYDPGEQFTTHHDFGYPDHRHPDSPSRSINVIMYLNDEGLVGGETTFPKIRTAEPSTELSVKPKKGKAVVFYMLTPDGNRDELTAHAALPVVKGEKSMANLWIHDPIRQ